MSRLMAAKLRNSVPMPPSPPAFDTAAASSAEVQVPIGARMIGTSMPNRSQSRVVSMAHLRTFARHREIAKYEQSAMSKACAQRIIIPAIAGRIACLWPVSAFLAPVLAADSVVDDGVPGIVNADEQQQQQYGGAHAKQRLARENEGCRCGQGEQGIGRCRQDNVKQPVFKFRYVCGLGAHASNDDHGI